MLLVLLSCSPRLTLKVANDVSYTRLNYSIHLCSTPRSQFNSSTIPDNVCPDYDV